MSSLRISGSFLLISLMILVSAAAIDTRRSDVNGNGVVEMGDIEIISRHFNEAVSEPYPAYDVNMDGIVDIGDLTLAGQHFNESISTSSMISSGDGLTLNLGENGTIEGISINDTSLPMLAAQGGFSFREVLTSPPNLIANSGFESGAATPLSWSFVTSSGNTPVWDTISRTGARSIKISIPGTTNNRSGYPKSDLVEAGPLTYYTLSAWLKAEGAGGTNSPAVRVVELDSNRNWITQTTLAFPKGTYDWTQNKLTFRTGINTSYLYVYASIWEGYGTFWLDDVELSPFFGPTIYLNGALTQSPDGTVTQRARANDIDFTFYYRPKDRYIELQGEMQDLRGEDRALQVMYNLPLNASGWRWGDYIRGSREINGSTHYENVYNIGDTRTQSTYPFASIDNNTHGMSIAVPMDVPRIYRKGYNLDDGYSIQYDFGLSNQTLKIGPGHANFTFVVYKTDEPEWGFRSVVKKYYEMYPGFFAKRVKKEGLWAFYANMSSISNISDFNFAFDESAFENEKQFEKNRVVDTLFGIYSLKYVEPWGIWRYFGNNSTKPSYENRINALYRDLTNETLDSLWNVPISIVANSVINSAPYTANGSFHIDSDDFFWHKSFGGEEFWWQNYPTNPDPDLPEPSRYNMDYNIKIKSAWEQEDEGGFIDNWIFGKYNFWDNSTAHSGNYSAKVRIPPDSPDKFSGIWKSEYIKVSPNTNYTFSAWIKNQNSSGNPPAARVAEIGDNGWIRQWGLVVASTDSDWTFRSINFTTTNNTSKAYVYMNIWNGTGTGWFDNLSLTQERVGFNVLQNEEFEDNMRGNQSNYRFDGVFMDSLLAGYPWATLENYRTSHWNLADFPLVFGYSSKQSVLLGAFSQYEYIENISRTLHENDKLLGANAFTTSHLFYGHMLDMLGSEIFDIETDIKSSYKRTLSNQKLISNQMQRYRVNSTITHEEVEDYIKNSMFYGIFPSIFRANSNLTIYWNDSNLYERDRSLFKAYIPLIKEIVQAGWEPITYAKTDNTNIKIERYGYFDKNNLYYTVGNDGLNTENGVLVIDIAKQGFNGEVNTVEITELISKNTFEREVLGGKLSFDVLLTPQNVLVYKIGVHPFQ